MIGDQIGHIEIIQLKQLDRRGKHPAPERMVTRLDRLGGRPEFGVREFGEEADRGRIGRCLTLGVRQRVPIGSIQAADAATIHSAAWKAEQIECLAADSKPTRSLFRAFVEARGRDRVGDMPVPTVSHQAH